MTEQEFFKRYIYNVQTNNIGGGDFGTVNYKLIFKSRFKKSNY